jgi:hypothetical protein
MRRKTTFFRKHIRTGLIVLGCMMFLETMNAQKISYNYDESGNRIKRYIIVTKSLAIDTSNYTVDNDSISDNLTELSIWDDEKKDAFEVLVYPNPTNGILEIELPELKPNQKAQAYLYSRKGLLVKQIDRLQRRQTIDISALSVGIYVMRITVDDKTVIRSIIKGEY